MINFYWLLDFVLQCDYCCCSWIARSKLMVENIRFKNNIVQNIAAYTERLKSVESREYLLKYRLEQKILFRDIIGGPIKLLLENKEKGSVAPAMSYKPNQHFMINKANWFLKYKMSS